MEVLVALGIFTVGLVAVAAIFPTAITIQRDTVRAVDGRRIGKNAKAMILATARTDSATNNDNPDFEMNYDPQTKTGSLEKFIKNISTYASATNPTPVMPLIDQLGMAAPESFDVLLNLDTRSYPKNNPNVDQRDYYWYPLLKVADATSLNPRLSMILMVMHRDGTDLPPQVRKSNPINLTLTTGNVIFLDATDLLFNDGTGDVDNDKDNDGLPDFIQAGDTIVGDDGLTHRVVLADGNTITVSSPNLGNLSSFYFAVAIDRIRPFPDNIKREGRSPLIWVEDGISVSVNR